MDMFPTFIAAAAIGALALGSWSYYLASPYSGGAELGITVFTPNMVVNTVTYAVLKRYAYEPLVLIKVSQQ